MPGILKPNRYFTKTEYPYDYQVEGILSMLKAPRFILGDDVGLGKTSEAIITASYIKSAYPDAKFLVLTESIAFQQWLDEFQFLTPGIKTKLVTAQTHPDTNFRIKVFRQHQVDVILTGYSLIYDYWSHILAGMGQRWICIADEPNYFKNMDTQLHRKMEGMLNGEQPASRAYGLTATVIENRLEEAFGIFKIIVPGTFPSKKYFENQYCEMRTNRDGRQVVGSYVNLAHFRETIKPVFLGRLQDDPKVKQALPEVVPKDIQIVLSKEQSLKLMEAMDRIIRMPDGEVQQIDILPSLILNQQIANDPRLKGFNIEGAKTKALIETLTNSLKGQRVVVYSKLRTMIDLLEADLKKAGLEVVRITGAEDSEQRQVSKERFMSDGPDRCNILLMTKAGMKAVNLQKGGHLFFYDLPWSYGWYRQIIGRLKRTGSTFKTIGVYHLLATLHPEVADQMGTKKTIDHHTLETVKRKHKLFSAITGDINTLEGSTSDVLDIWEQIKKAEKVAA